MNDRFNPYFEWLGINPTIAQPDYYQLLELEAFDADAERVANAGVHRYEPRSQKFDIYVNFGFANPHGHVFDRWGQDFVVDGTGANPWHAALFSGHMPYPMRHNNPPQLYRQKTRPCPGMEILSSKHFPEESQGNLLVGNVIGFQGILQYKFNDKVSARAQWDNQTQESSVGNPGVDLKVRFEWE